MISPLLPKSQKIYNSILLSQKGFDSDSPIYVPKDDPSSGIVVALFAEYKHPTTAISFISKEDDAEKACQMVASCVDWTKEIVFGPISDWHKPFLVQICSNKSKIKPTVDCYFFELGQSNTFKELSTLPEGVCVKPLDPKFAELVDSNWKFQSECSLKWIRHQCQAGLGIGVFLKDREEPVSWMMTYKYGSMGLLYTKSEFRGHGYARLCVSALSNKIAEIGITPNVFIELDNAVSTSMFERLAFEKKCEGSWIVTIP